MVSSVSSTNTEPDSDGDGIDDATEMTMARDYFPYFSPNARDGCARHGVLFRLAPHPDDPTKVAIWYVVLFERDCGLRGIGAHVGDDEVFGEIVDPSMPAPAGILAVRAISHQNTTCERVTTCGSLPGCSACTVADRGGRPFPVVFSSKDKHGNYAGQTACNFWLCDLAGCALSDAPDEPLFVNAGEPSKPMTRDLTSSAFVNAENGWTEPALMHFDPWGDTNFGGAGNVTSDLTDLSFLISPDGC